MWVASLAGFFSVVAADRDGFVQVRARRQMDLERLMALVGVRRYRRKIIRTPKADYLYRVVVRTGTWIRWSATLAESAARYTNFKDAVKATDPDRAAIYSRAWAVFRDIEVETTTHSTTPSFVAERLRERWKTDGVAPGDLVTAEMMNSLTVDGDAELAWLEGWIAAVDLFPDAEDG